ncbi:GGDEF domain-containing protein [Dyella amyloliquefaciens]|uniref:GGDEF domain-containing protein n=1 Tax=Dyella amyloliquefaciens TaxID=1770545 RepID=UPI00102E8352|nr:GGDEF domain-containing protein [Dyella amyloliquefaciens]
MNHPSSTRTSTYGFERSLPMAIIVLALLSTSCGWWIMGAQGLLSPVLRGMFGTCTVVLVVLFVVAWRRWLEARAIALACLLFAATICALCMALRLYSPRYGAGLDLQPLYLWIPLIYVFAFTLTGHKSSLAISLGVLVLFVLISLHYLVRDIHAPYANFTVQLHIVSAALVASLYFFSSFQRRYRLAERTVGQLAELSNTDELTKLSNRRRMASLIDAELGHLRERGAMFAVLLFDIDHFKVVNDRYGHGTGDEALIALAQRAAQVFRGMDTLGRWGGDEFVALVRNVDVAEALHIADVLCRHVATEPMDGGHAITISCGAAMALETDNVDSVLQRADAALYAAKRAGRNRVEGMSPTV